MDIVEIEATANTPAVKFCPDKGELEIKGISISENSARFYRPLIEGVEQYLFKPVSPTIIQIHLDYFNTATAKCIIEILKKMEGLPKRGIKVQVNWYYKADEPASYHSGMDYKSILTLDFNMVKV